MIPPLVAATVQSRHSVSVVGDLGSPTSFARYGPPKRSSVEFLQERPGKDGILPYRSVGFRLPPLHSPRISTPRDGGTCPEPGNPVRVLPSEYHDVSL